MNALILAGLIFATLAAVLHVFIFYLESVAWTTPRAAKVFGLTPASAEATKEMAFNQGFYNLFLAVLSLAGVVAYAVGHHTVGATLIFSGAGSMVAAALVLLLTSPDKRKAALQQLSTPLLAVVLLALGLAF